MASNRIQILWYTLEMPAFENKPKQTRDDMGKEIITMDQYQKILEFNPHPVFSDYHS